MIRAKYKSYPKYKQSRVVWIGELPEHWQFFKILWSYKQIGSGNTPTSSNESYYDETGFPWVITGDLNDGIINDTSKHITKKAIIENPSLKLYQKNSLIIAMYGATIGKLGQLNIEAYTNQACCVFGTSNFLSNRFTFYWLLGLRQHIINLSAGGGQPNVSQKIIKQISICIPPLPEQRTIASFLDRETARIDNIISKQTRMIELLKEKRSALITQAVTKGLDPKAKMKKSGVEWIGEIPEGWEVIKLKFISTIEYGLSQPPEKRDEGTALIRATNVKRGTISDVDLIFIDPRDITERKITYLQEGDIIVVRSGAYTADSAIIPLEYSGAIAGYDMVVHVNKKNSTDFIAYSLLADYILYAQMVLKSSRAAQPHLNKEELGTVLIALPPNKEQQEIAKFIKSNTGNIDTLMKKIESQITLLNEYKQSLITHAVTGKIDVRGLANE